MPSIGLMSPTNCSRSTIVNLPGSFEGSVGFQFGPFFHRIRLVVPVDEADEDLGHDARAHRPEPLAAHSNLRLLEDVVPERRRSRAGRAAWRLRRPAPSRSHRASAGFLDRLRIRHERRRLDPTATRASPRASGCGMARLPPPPGSVCSAATRNGSILRELVERKSRRSRRSLEVVEAPPVDDPVARQQPNRRGPGRRVWGEITDDAARQAR